MRRRAVGLLAVGLLAACTHGAAGGGNAAPADDATLTPVAAFKDGLLYAAIKAKLGGFDIDSATRVSVSVRAGVVTLRGVLPSEAMKRRDAEIVRSVRGVTRIEDLLIVRPRRLGRNAAAPVAVR